MLKTKNLSHNVDLAEDMVIVLVILDTDREIYNIKHQLK